jgi:spermidine/putrescine transport system substrate-binding protein
MKITSILGATALASLATAAAAQDPDLIVFDYAGFENPLFHTTYAAAHGQSPSFTFFGDEDEAFQKVTSGFQTDVTHICAGSVTRWIEAGILEPWDTSRIPNFANLDPALLAGASDADGNVYFIPTDWGSTAIAYNPDQVTADQVASLQIFTDPAFAGRMSVPDNVDDTWALAFLATGVTDKTTATEDQFQAAAAWLRQIHPNLRTYWTDPAELAQLHATGEILVSWAWNETYPTLKGEGVPVGFQREAAEGSSVWYCGLVNMANGPGSEDKAYDYVNAFLDPSVTLSLVETGWGHSNLAAMTDQITAEDLELSGLGAITAPIGPQSPMSNELRERLAEEFELIKAGF